MGRKAKVTAERKLSAVKDYLEGQKSQGQIAKENGVHVATVQQWLSVYQSMGVDGLITRSKNAGYSRELKLLRITFQVKGHN